MPQTIWYFKKTISPVTQDSIGFTEKQERVDKIQDKIQDKIPNKIPNKIQDKIQENLRTCQAKSCEIRPGCPNDENRKAFCFRNRLFLLCLNRAYLTLPCNEQLFQLFYLPGITRRQVDGLGGI